MSSVIRMYGSCFVHAPRNCEHTPRQVIASNKLSQGINAERRRQQSRTPLLSIDRMTTAHHGANGTCTAFG